MNEDEAYRFVLGILLQHARGDMDAVKALATTVQWNQDTFAKVMQQAISVAFGAAKKIAELTEEDVEVLLRRMAMEAAV